MKCDPSLSLFMVNAAWFLPLQSYWFGYVKKGEEQGRAQWDSFLPIIFLPIHVLIKNKNKMRERGNI